MASLVFTKNERKEKVEPIAFKLVSICKFYSQGLLVIQIKSSNTTNMYTHVSVKKASSNSYVSRL